MGVPKGKIGRVVFRKIHGRIIPIRISNKADDAASGLISTAKVRKITASLPDGSPVGRLHLQLPSKGKSAEVLAVSVEKPFRKKGISKQLFARATQFLERAGFKFLRSDDIQHPAQVKIRSAYGRYKAGKKSKNRTKYIADQFGPYGEQSKKVSKSDALFYLNQNRSKFSTGRQVKATTKLKKLRKK